MWRWGVGILGDVRSVVSKSRNHVPSGAGGSASGPGGIVKVCRLLWGHLSMREDFWGGSRFLGERDLECRDSDFNEITNFWLVFPIWLIEWSISHHEVERIWIIENISTQKVSKDMKFLHENLNLKNHEEKGENSLFSRDYNEFSRAVLKTNPFSRRRWMSICTKLLTWRRVECCWVWRNYHHLHVRICCNSYDYGSLIVVIVSIKSYLVRNCIGWRVFLLAQRLQSAVFCFDDDKSYEAIWY